MLPEKPEIFDDERLSPEELERRSPLSTAELRAFYLRHGFREFTKEELKYYVIMLGGEPAMRPDYPPYPEPVFGETPRDQVVERLSSMPLLKNTGLVRRQADKRRPLKQWEEACSKAWETARENGYLKSETCQRVKQHLVQSA